MKYPKSARALHRPRPRAVLSVVVLLLVLALFAYYIDRHRSLLTQLSRTSPLTIVEVLLLYLAFFVTLVGIFQAGLRMCRVHLKPSENFLLNGYSMLANFFVPGQSGPIVRGAYLKKMHNVPVKQYIFATLLYYAAYALLSTLLLLATSQAWWLTLLVLLLVAGVSLAVLVWYKNRKKVAGSGLDLRLANIGFLVLVTLAQAVVQILLYFVELHSVNQQISLGQTITYTGAANFAIFVALTPGAIGIREGFLVFSERLHHISSATIISANVIDRAVFLVFLGLLFVVLVSFHAKQKLQLPRTETPKDE